jgi:hypothetical protein
MLTRTRSNSFLVKGALTRPVQFAGRSTGHGDNDEDIAAKCNRQTEAWGRICELTRRYAGLPEDFDDDMAVVVGESVVTLVPERGYELPFAAQLAGVDRWTLIRVGPVPCIRSHHARRPPGRAGFSGTINPTPPPISYGRGSLRMEFAT